ncbi:Ig-like domain-containing protein [Paenibacillus ferrarius]|uniref:Ig-like domain-containing protein n=1 Tax=Paenibacillus ferrarius TaxID=1469647 RepID=UPI003D2CE9BF
MLKRKLSAMLASAQLLSLVLGSSGALASAPDDPSSGGAGASVTSAVYAANSTSSSITLAWPAVPGAAGYNLYRSLTSSGTFTKVNGAPVAATTYLDSGLTANVRYFYKVTSISGGLESDVDQASILTQPDFGPNVYIFDSLTPPADIQRTSDNLFAIQEQNQFGQERYAMLFKQGSYTTNIRLGFYTQVAGLGMLPDDVNFTGGVSVDANWLPPHNATQNFWRSVENFAETPSGGNMLWAVSQAASMRRVHVKGGLTLHDQGGWASGGYLADSVVDGNVVPGSQQQWFSRNSQWASWNGSVWNTTLLGNVNPPVENWPTNAYTVINQTPVVREKPFLTWDQASMQYNVFVPDVRMNANGTSWGSGAPAGTAISIENFFIANPAMSVDTINAALAQGKHLLLTPGVYHTSKPIEVTNPNTVVLGLGLATLHADSGNVALKVADVDGVKIAGLLFEAGATNSPVLLQVGAKGSTANHAANPTSLQDLYFRVGGDALALADVCVEINSNNVIGDHFWVWRADHGTGAGWDSNLTTNGMIVNGNDVVFYGLFVEHFHQYQTVWNGERGKMYFYQTEIPYDVPNQERWMSSGGTVNGYASYKVADTVTSHEAYGLGLYSFFRDAEVKLDRAIEIPDVPGVKIHHATTVFLGGMGEITHVANAAGTPVKKGTMRTTLNDYVPRTTSGIQPVVADTYAGKAPFLPDTVTQQFSDASSKLARVTWNSITPMQFAAPGTFTVQGVVEGTTVPAQATVTVYPAPNAPVTGITVGGAGNATTITAKHGTLQMLAAVSPAGADNSSVTWRVFDTYGQPTSKASIDANGLLTAADNGMVKVVASANDHSGVKGEAWITITGQVIKVSGITVTGAGSTSLVALKGGTLQMSAAVTPDNADDPSVTWSVVNPDDSATTNASISTTGLLTAKANGAVKVVAKANDGSNITGSMLVTLIGQSVNLDSRWSWVREGAGYWALDPKNGNVMKLSTQEGTWGSSSNYPKGVLLTDPGTVGDFTITTKLKFDASNNFEWAGLIVYQDDKNLISLGRSAVNQLRFSQVSNGTQTDKNIADPLIGSDIFLKIQKVGTTYTAYYSADGQTWTQHANTFTMNLSNAKVGIFTRKLNTAIASKTAEFTDFSVNGTVLSYWHPVSSVSVASAGGLTEITAKGGTLQMAADVQPSTAANKTVFWSVYNPDGAPSTRATIDASGLLVAQGNGPIQVVATAADGSAAQGSMALQISGQTSVSAISIIGAGGKAAITAKHGTLQMVADVAPSDAAIRTVTWSVYNPDGTETDRASFDVNGVLTALKNGQVKVVATADDGSGVKGEALITLSGQVLVSGITVSSAGGLAAIASKSGTLQMLADVVPSDADIRTVTWTVLSEDGMATDKAVIDANGLLTAVKNGQVKVVATADDGSGVKGEAVIAISGQDPVSPTDPITPSSPADTSSVGSVPSVTSSPMEMHDGKAVITLTNGSKEAILTAPSLQLAGDRLVEVRNGGIAVSIPSAVMQQLVGQVNGEANLLVKVRIDAVPAADSKSDNATLKFGGHVYDLSLTVTDGGGKETKLASFKEPVRVVIPYGNSQFDEELIAAYLYDEQSNKWQYIGGHKDTIGKTITFDTPHFSKYAVMEYNKSFNDVPKNHWAYRTLQVLSAQHIVSGITDTEFKPEGTTTRAEFVTLLVKALGLKASSAGVQFEDVSANEWYASDIQTAYHAGLISGISAHEFAPNAPITREQMASLIVRAYEHIHGVQDVSADHVTVLTDSGQVSSWATADINKAIEIGLMQGQGQGIFAAQSHAVRAETAQAILNMLKKLKTW